MCQLLASSAPLVTVRLDVATKEAAEAVAQALPRNSSLLHLMMGGPVPEHVLSFVAASLSSNTVNKLQQQDAASVNNSPAAVTSPAQQQPHQQQLWSPNRQASAGRGSPGAFRARTPGSTSRSNGSPARPPSAGLLGAGGAGRPVLVRTTTQQARNLSTIDPTGEYWALSMLTQDGCQVTQQPACDPDLRSDFLICLVRLLALTTLLIGLSSEASCAVQASLVLLEVVQQTRLLRCSGGMTVIIVGSWMLKR